MKQNQTSRNERRHHRQSHRPKRHQATAPESKGHEAKFASPRPFSCQGNLQVLHDTSGSQAVHAGHFVEQVVDEEGDHREEVEVIADQVIL